MNVSVTSLSKLISTRKEELARLLEWRGTNFPVVERQNDLRISFIELELEDLEELNNQPQLNDNQQMVLDELKINTDYQKFNKFQSVFWLLNTIIQYPDTLLAKAYKELTQDELEQIFQAFSQWANEQEEAK